MPSPRPGFSTLTTSAPRSPSSDVHHGPAAWCERSMTRMPASAARRSVMPRLLPASASPRPRALTLRAGSCLGGRMAARLELPADHRSEEHTSELQSRQYLVCRLLLEKKKQLDKEHQQNE